MTELQLYKLLYDDGCFYLQQEPTWEKDELLVWFHLWAIECFTKLVGYNYFCEGDVMVSLQADCICFDLVPVCEYFGIDPENICKKTS